MSELHHQIDKYTAPATTEKAVIVRDIQKQIETAGYEIVEQNDEKPWGAYFRIESEQADVFVDEFFPGLTPQEARLGVENAELSPKILLVSPHQRLSWQYHNRRAERWAFLTAGAYNKSKTDDQGELVQAGAGDIVQFDRGERHRLVGADDHYTLVAEIWQHTDPTHPTDEADIVRLADDYRR